MGRAIAKFYNEEAAYFKCKMSIHDLIRGSLAANQGLYNGFLAAGLLWGLVSTGGFDALIFFLSCIIIAGIYGALTAKRSILFLQALPAAIAISLLILNN